MRSLTNFDIQTLNDIDRYLIDNNTHDSQMTNILKESGYLDIWKMDYKINPWKYDGNIFLGFNNEKELVNYKKNTDKQDANYDDLRISMAVGELSLFSGKTVESNQALRFLSQQATYEKYYKEYHLSYFLTLSNLYKQLLINCRKRIDAAEYVLRHYKIRE